MSIVIGEIECMISYSYWLILISVRYVFLVSNDYKIALLVGFRSILF